MKKLTGRKASKDIPDRNLEETSNQDDERLREALKLVRGISRLPLRNDERRADAVRKAFSG